MNPLSDYITERIRVDNTNIKRKHPGDFPINGNIHDVINFLESYGFEEMPPVYRNELKEYIEILNSYHKRCFINYRVQSKNANDGFIVFGDTSKSDISKNNIMYYIAYNSNEMCCVYGKTNPANNEWIVNIQPSKFKEGLENYFKAL
jgi:hypothetical protein